MPARAKLSFSPSHDPLEQALAEQEIERYGEPSFDVSGERPITGVKLELLPPGLTLYRGPAPVENTTASKVWKVAALVSAGVSAAHGYLRSDGSLWSAILWSMMGSAFPIAVPIVAVYQGFGKLDPEIAAKKSADVPGTPVVPSDS